jgi:hypothetical protein
LGSDPVWHPIPCLIQVGDEPGFFAVLNAPTLKEAQAMVAGGAERLEVFDLEITPVNQFPHFD